MSLNRARVATRLTPSRKHLISRSRDILQVSNMEFNKKKLEDKLGALFQCGDISMKKLIIIYFFPNLEITPIFYQLDLIIKRFFSLYSTFLQILGYILSINEGQINTKQLKVQLQINNLKAQTLVFQVYIHKISLDITVITSKDQVLRLKIYPGARFEINTSIVQPNCINQSNTVTSTATTSAINTTRKPKSEENLQNQQQINFQTQQTITDEIIPVNGNANGTVAFKQIFSQQYSQDSKFLQGNDEGQLALSSQEKSLLMPSLIGGGSVSTQQQQQQKSGIINNNSVNQNNMIGLSNQNSQNPAYMFYAPSDFLIKDKWVNLIVDLKSFFREICDDFVVKNIEIGSQCRLKSIFYSKQSELNASLIGKHELLVNSGTNKFIPQIINFQHVSQMMDDCSPKHGQGQRKSIQNNINFLLPHAATIQTNSHAAGDINSSQVDASIMIHNSIALPAKTPNKSSRYQSRYSVHLSNYKHSQVALYQANGQAGSSKSYSKQPPPPLSQQHQSPSSGIVGAASISNSSTQAGSTQLSKIMKRRESKNGYSGNYPNNSFQQQQPNNSIQYNQHSYLSNNVSFEQPNGILHSHINTQNILYYQSTSQSTHPNCAQNSDEEGGKCLYSGSNTQRTSSVYFYNAKRNSRSNVSGMQQHSSYHASSQQQYQNSYLNNSITNVNANNGNSGQLNSNNNSIRLPKIISLLKQRSSSIYSGVTNRSHQIVEELDIASVQNISNLNSTRRNKDSSRLYQVGIIKSPNNNISNNNLNNDRQHVNYNSQNGSCPHKSTINNKIQNGLEALLIQNGEIINTSPSKNNINSSRNHQKNYKSSQHRFVTMSINQSPKDRNNTQTTLANFDLLPNNTSIHQPNSNDLYNIADQGGLRNEDEFNIEKRIRSEDDIDDVNRSIRPENSKLSVMSKLSTVLFKNSIGTQGTASGYNKENDPRSRNTPAQKKEKQLNLNNKRRSSLFSASSIKHTQIQQNCQTINSINTINAKGSIQTSRRQNSINNQQQNMQYPTQQSSIHNEDDQLNTDNSQYAYYAPKNKKSKIQSQSPSQIVNHRNGSISVRKGNGQNYNTHNKMQILNSPSQQSPINQQRNSVRNSYSIINKRQSAAAVQSKQNSVQIEQNSFNNNSADSQINPNDLSAIIQNEKIERKRKIIMQQQYLQNKDSFNQEMHSNASHSQPPQKIGTPRMNYQSSPPPPIHKHNRDNIQEAAAQHVQAKSKISLIPSHNLQHSLQTQIIQTNPSNSLQASINQGYQPSQSMAQANSLKKQLHNQQLTGPTPSKSNSRNQSPLVNKFNNNGKNQLITNSNSSNNAVNIKIDPKSNSLERGSIIRKSPPHNNNQSQQQNQSPNIKKNPQKSTFSYEKQQQSSQNSLADKSKQNQTAQQQDKRNKQQMGLDFSKLPTNITQAQEKRNPETFVIKTEEAQDNGKTNYELKRLPSRRKGSEGQEKSPSRGREKKELPKKNLLQAFNQADARNPDLEDNSNTVHIKNEQLNPQNEEFEDEQKIAEYNDIYYRNMHRFSSTFNNPELCLPLALIPKNNQPPLNKPNDQTQTRQSSDQTKTLFQIGLLKNPPIALTASNLHNMKDQQFELGTTKQEIKQNTNNSKQEKNSSNQQEKQYKRKYQQNQLYKKKSKSSLDTINKTKEEGEQPEEIIELQKSECIPTNPNEETIEEKIDTKSISLTNQSKSMNDLDKKNEIMLKTSGSVYESEHMTSSEEECNESGLAISIQVDNIDLKEENDFQTIGPHRKKQPSTTKKPLNRKSSPKEESKKKEESENKFIKEIEKQIPSSNSIEVSRVIIVQDEESEQLINQINSLPYTSDWRIQSFLIENKTDILKNRINLSNLINGVGPSSKTQPIDNSLNNREMLEHLLKSQVGLNQNISPPIKKELQKQKSLSIDDQQTNYNKKFGAPPQILVLNDVIQATD